MKAQIREKDVFARIGGDEFCILLKGCPEHVARAKAIQMQADFAAGNEEAYPKSFSFGIVQIPKGHGKVELDLVLQQADQAMYEQKKAHKRMRD